MKSGVITVLDRTKALRDAVNLLAKMEVLAGIPQDKSSRDGDIGNATLGYIHNFGSPINNIPARPFLEPGISKAQDKIVGYLKEAGVKGLDGNANAVKTSLNRVGLTAQNSIRSMFTDNDWQELDARTVARKESDRPLIDTGQLRKSISYVVRDRK